MPRSLSTLANRHYACEVGKSSTNGPGRKRVSTKGDTEIEEAIGVDPTQEAAAEGWILEMGRP